MKGKKIVLGVTGGIAAYKAAELAREFIKRGAAAGVGAAALGGCVTNAVSQGKDFSSIQWDYEAGLVGIGAGGFGMPGAVRAREADLPSGSLDAADEVFLTNSVQEIVPVAVVEDRPVPGRDLGMRLRDAYRARTGGRKQST